MRALTYGGKNVFRMSNTCLLELLRDSGKLIGFLEEFPIYTTPEAAKYAAEEAEYIEIAARWTAREFVPPDPGADEEPERRKVVIAAFFAADRGDYQPGIDLGIVPETMDVAHWSRLLAWARFYGDGENVYRMTYKCLLKQLRDSGVLNQFLDAFPKYTTPEAVKYATEDVEKCTAETTDYRAPRDRRNSDSRWSGPAFVPSDHGTDEERKRRNSVIAAFDAADRGDYQPGIDLGIFPKSDTSADE